MGAICDGVVVWSVNDTKNEISKFGRISRQFYGTFNSLPVVTVSGPTVTLKAATHVFILIRVHLKSAEAFYPRIKYERCSRGECCIAQVRINSHGQRAESYRRLWALPFILAAQLPPFSPPGTLQVLCSDLDIIQRVLDDLDAAFFGIVRRPGVS